MNKEDFIKILSNVDQETINKIISEKGKEPKLVPVIKIIK